MSGQIRYVEVDWGAYKFQLWARVSEDGTVKVTRIRQEIDSIGLHNRMRSRHWREVWRTGKPFPAGLAALRRKALEELRGS